MTVVRVIEKTRIEHHGHGNPHSETWTEIEDAPEEVSQEMADWLWHEHGIDVEEEGIEVVE